MPYITHERRVALDVIIEGLINRIKQLQDIKRGDLNYVVTRLVLETLNQDTYHSLSDCVSVLRDAADEIQRRLLGPYEDTAMLKNGDMLCFQKPYAHTPLWPVNEKQGKPKLCQCAQKKRPEVHMDDWMGNHPRVAEAACDVHIEPIQDVADELAEKVLAQRRQAQQEEMKRQVEQAYLDGIDDAINGRR